MEKEKELDIREIVKEMGLDLDKFEPDIEMLEQYHEKEQYFINYGLYWDFSSIAHLVNKKYVLPDSLERVTIRNLTDSFDYYKLYLLVLIGTNRGSLDKDSKRAEEIINDWGGKGWSFNELYNNVINYMHYNNGFFYQEADTQMIIMRLVNASKLNNKVMMKIELKNLIDSIMKNS